MPSQIIREDKAGKGELWTLDIGDEFVVLTQPGGQQFLRWTPAQVNLAVLFPSFSKSIKYTGFQTANQGMYLFNLDGATAKELRHFANRAIAAGGPKAIRAVLVKAVLTSFLGLAVLALGVVALSITITELSTGKSATGQSHPIGVVTTLVGLAIFCRGLFYLRQFFQLRKLVPPHK